MNTGVMFSSKADEWSTPQNVYDRLHAEFNFEIDLAATAENTKCASFCSLETDALSETCDWSKFYRRGWLNPPYSKTLCRKFIAKAAAQRCKGFLTVMLLPVRTDTKAFHEHIYDIDTWQPRKRHRDSIACWPIEIQQ